MELGLLVVDFISSVNQFCLSWGVYTLQASFQVDMVVVGKDRVKRQSFDPLLSQIRKGLGPGTLPHQEVKGPHSLCWAFCIV